MRLVWWIFLVVLASVSTAQAQQADSVSTGSATLPELSVSPNLQLHKNLNEDQMSVFLIGDKVESNPDGKVTLSGGAEVRRIDSVVKGDRIDYQRSTGQVHVVGNGLIMRDASIVRGPTLNYNVNSETGEVNDPNFWLGAGGGAGKATKADILSRSKMRLTTATYSGCPCPDPAWYIKASRVDLDSTENEGVAHNGVLYFKDVPILASPYFTFPIKKERKSGFLLPTYGTTSNSGFEFSLPYYFNLAPNYDATLTPKYMSKSGLQMGGEFRYLGSSYSGQLAGTYLAKDALTGDARWMYSAQHNQNLGGGFSAMYDIRHASDDNYFRDFSTLGLNESTTNLLPSIAQVSWSGLKYWNAYLQTYTYQTLQDASSAYTLPPYDKLPELHVQGARYNWGGFDVQSDNYATKFRSPVYDGNIAAFANGFYNGRQIYGNHVVPDGTRFTSYTTVSYPIVHAGWYITPKIGLHMSQYNTEWYGLSDYPRTQSRILPIMSLDSGMTFERRTSLFGNDSIQTLEPRIYYLRVPYRDQSQLPVFDTALSNFNFSQAFDENLYSGGWDRIANANQVTLGLTTRWLDEKTGFERLSLQVAQRIYFEDQQVTLPGETPRTNTKSDFLFGANAALTDTLNVRFDAQVSPYSKERNEMSAGFKWQPKRLAILSAAYRYKRDPAAVVDPNVVYSTGYVDNSTEQVTVSGQWPITSKIYALGRIDYSLQDKRTTQSIVGLEYKGDCCWAARVVLQRSAVSADQSNTAMFFQLELSGLGSLGSDPMSLLSKTITGYEPINPPIPDKTTFERYE